MKEDYRMKRKERRLLLLARGGMEFSWLYAWAAFFMLIFAQRPFPLPEALGTFGLAGILTEWGRGKGWRIVQLVALQFCGLLLAVLQTLHAFYHPSDALWNWQWLPGFFHTPKSALEGFVLLILLAWIPAFWGVGMMIVRKPAAYTTISTRFDLGIMAFLVVLLLKIPLQRELNLDMSLLEYLIFPFFLFSLLAFSLARNRNDAQKDFLAGYRGVGVILSFTITILLGGAGLVALFLPYMTLAAESAYGLLKAGTIPLLPYLENFLRFIFGAAHFPVAPPPSSTGGQADFSAIGAAPGWLDGFGSLMKILFWGVGALAAVLLLVMAIKLLWPWLMSRTALNDAEKEKGQGIWRKLWRIFMLCCEMLERQFSEYRRAAQLYAALLRWGRYSGAPHRVYESPLEFGARLKHNFPKVSKEIDMIINAFHQETYAERELDPQQLAAAQQALRTLRHPLFWGHRLKSSFRAHG